MRILPAHAQHIGLRSYQQDCCGFANAKDEAFLAHGGFLAVLCDGMGGMQYGDVASQTAVRAMLDAYARKTPVETIPEALERSARAANRQVIEAARNLGAREGVGTTLVAAVLHGSSLYFFSVGDSGLFHVHDGQLRTVNRPHVFSNLLDQAVANGQMSWAEAARHPEREALTSFIGLEELEEIDRNTEAWPAGEGDTILLASDGLFKTLNAEEIASCLKGHPQSWPAALVARTLAQRNPGQDNVTVMSITLDTGTLGEWTPEAEADVPRGRGSLDRPAAVRSPAHVNPWLIAGAILVLAALGLGLWYFSRQ